MNKRSVALFDFDKTIYSEYSIFSTTKYLIELGYMDMSVEVRMLEEFAKYETGMISYEEVGNRVLVIQAEGLRGVSFAVIREKIIEFFNKNKNKFYPYFEKILPRLKQGHDVVLVTASPQFVAEAIEEIFELNGYLSTVYEVVEGVFTGKVEKTTISSKGESIRSVLEKYGGETMAFGDSDSDVEMLSMVKVPVCINPIGSLKKTAEEKNWLITDGKNTEEKVFALLS